MSNYVTRYDAVIQIDPSPIYLTRDDNNKKKDYLYTPISFNSSYKHHSVSGYTVSFSGTITRNGKTSDGKSYLSIAKTDKTSYSIGETITCTEKTEDILMNTGDSYICSPIDSNNPIYSFMLCYYAYDNDTDATLTVLSANASPIYGSKINPTVSSDYESGFVNYNQSKKISYSVAYNSTMHSQFTITGGTFYYKLTSASSYSSISFTGSSITIPENTFAHGSNYNVYSVVTVDDGQTSTTPVKTLSTVDGTPYCTAISPVNEIVYGSATLKWSYSNSSGMNQFKYDLQISSDGSSWTYVANGVTSSETSRYVSSIASGISYWRVRSYNQDGVASSWSQASFVNSVPPDAPVITQIIKSGRPVVKWSCSDQVAYEFILGNYKSGDQYTSNRYCFVDDYIVNGNYQIKVRVSNKYGLWSNWTTSTYSQNMTASVPNASIEQIEKGFQITLTDSSFSKVYVIRNGVVIGKFNGNTYFDPYVNADTEYIIRGVMTDDTFADLQITKSYVCRKSALITTSGDVYYISDRIDNHPEISFSVKRSSVTSEFYGRSKPAHFMTDLYTRNWKVTCRYKDIKDHLGEVMFYRNYDGYSAWVVCTSTSSGITMYGDEVSIPLEETDYKEGIEYDL